MSEILLVNSPREKQPYLVNPANPWKAITIPKHRYAVWQDKKTKRFAKAPAWAEKTKGSFLKKHHLGKKKKISRKSKAGHRKVVARRAVRRITAPVPAAFTRTMTRQMEVLGGLRKAPGIKRSHKTMKTRKTRKARKAHRKTRRNPFNFKGFAKGFVKTDMLIDGALVAGGMFASKMAMDFAASKVAFLATPTGKIIGRVALGGLVKMSDKVGVPSRYANMLAIGVIAPAVLDIAEMVLPMVGYKGGVRLLESGYMPDAPQGQIASGYMPDAPQGGVAAGEFNFSE